METYTPCAIVKKGSGPQGMIRSFETLSEFHAGQKPLTIDGNSAQVGDLFYLDLSEIWYPNVLQDIAIGDEFVGVSGYDLSFAVSDDGITYGSYQPIGAWTGETLNWSDRPVFFRLRFEVTALNPGSYIYINWIHFSLTVTDMKPTAISLRTHLLETGLQQILQWYVEKSPYFIKKRTRVRDESLPAAGPGDNLVDAWVPTYKFRWGHPNHCQPTVTEGVVYAWDCQILSSKVNTSQYERTVRMEIGLKRKCGEKEQDLYFGIVREHMRLLFGPNGHFYPMIDMEYTDYAMNANPKPYRFPIKWLSTMGITEATVLSESEVQHGQCGCTWWRMRVQFSILHDLVFTKNGEF